MRRRAAPVAQTRATPQLALAGERPTSAAGDQARDGLHVLGDAGKRSLDRMAPMRELLAGGLRATTAHGAKQSEGRAISPASMQSTDLARRGAPSAR